MGNCLTTIHKKQNPVDQSPPATKDDKNIPAAGGGAAVRIKLVISKQELKELIRNGTFSITEEIRDFEEKLSFGWRPALESIPEGNGLQELCQTYYFQISIRENTHETVSSTKSPNSSSVKILETEASSSNIIDNRYKP